MSYIIRIYVKQKDMCSKLTDLIIEGGREKGYWTVNSDLAILCAEIENEETDKCVNDLLLRCIGVT